MVRHYCCVPYCKNQSDRVVRKLSWHCFPTDKQRQKLWIIAIRRDIGKNFQITKNTRVCSEHFRPEDFKPLLHTKQRLLKQDAVPSLFDFPVKKYQLDKQVRAESWNIRTEKSQNEVLVDPVSVGVVSSNTDIENSAIDNSAEQTDCIPQDQMEELYCPSLIEQDAAEALVQLCTTHPSTTEASQSTVMKSHELQKSTIQDTEQELKSTIEGLKTEISILKSSFKIISFIKGNNIIFNRYTGFVSYDVFLAVFQYLKPKAENLKYWTSQDKKSQGWIREDRMLSKEQELLMVLIHLHLGVPRIELCRSFHISEGYFSKIFSTWINFLSLELKLMFTVPSKKTIFKSLPSAFRTKELQNTRIILDCTEFHVQKPSSLDMKRELYSHYKHFQTYKALIGITPNGMVCFVSPLYGGGYSDKFITEESGVMKFLEPGDSVMVDKGFDIEHLLPPGVSLVMPPKFMKKRDIQMPTDDVKKTREIANVRVHVERAIRRIKEYQILKSVLPLNMIYVADQIITTCAYLTNFKKPLIQQ